MAVEDKGIQNIPLAQKRQHVPLQNIYWIESASVKHIFAVKNQI